MKKKMIFVVATATLFITAAAVSLYVRHSWYLYCTVVLTGYIALILLTALLKRSVNIICHYRQQRIRNKVAFYNHIAICFNAFGVTNALLLVAVHASVATRAWLIAANLVVANFFLIFAVWCCEGKDWKYWLPNTHFD